MSFENTEKEQEIGQMRPDPMFKEITRRAVQSVGLNLLNVELPQLLLADLVVAVPPDKDLSDTMFHFFASYNIIDFKSENDAFEKYELAKNLARTLLFFAKSQQVEYNQILTVFVCSHYPNSVIEHLKAENVSIEIDPNKIWLLNFRLWSLNVAIVVCRLLPIEAKYYQWLMFAPSNSIKWQEFVKILSKVA